MIWSVVRALLKVTLLLIFLAQKSIVASAQQKNPITADTIEIKTLIDQSKELTDSNPDSSLVLIEKASSIAIAHKYDYWIAKCFNMKGAIYFIKGDYTNALTHYYESIAYYEKLNHSLGLSQTNLNVGIIFSRTGNYEKATAKMLEALDYAEKFKLETQLSTIYNSLGVLAKQQKNYPEAIEFYKKSIAISTKANSVKEISGTYGNIANLYMADNQIDSAIYYNSKALHAFDSLGNKRGQIVCYNNLADCYRRLGEISKSLEFCKKAAELSKAAGFASHYLTALKGFAEAYIDQHNYKLALNYLEEITNYGHPYDRNQLLESYKLAARCYSELGMERKSIQMLTRAIALKDSLMNEEMLMAINRTKAAYELDKKETEIKTLKSENEARQLQIVQVIILFILLIVVIVLSVLYYSLSLRKKKEQAEITALRSQMNPHFIFNCLNSINRYIIKSTPETASSYLTKFSRLIRMILENSRSEEISLESELAALKLYIEMELLRFDNKFTYTINVSSDIDPASIQIPPMILQPYVENAIWHGLMKRSGEGILTVNICRNNNQLQVIIEDNGVGREASKENDTLTPEKKSIGMTITLQRLKMFASGRNKKSSVDISDLRANDGTPLGTKVTVLIPEMTS